MGNSTLLNSHLEKNLCPDLKKGDRVILIRMSDPISPVLPKSRGTVLNDGVDFLGEIIYSIRWDNSGSLNILSDINKLKELDSRINRSNDESEIEKLRSQIKDIEKNHDIWMLEDDYENLKTKKKSSINENIVDEKKIYKLIEKVGPFKTAMYFGGVEKFLKLLESIPGTDSIKEQFKGSCSVSYIGDESYPDAYFDFYILDYNIMDDDFVELIVDMKVDFSNLSGEEIYNLKQWMGVVADDIGFEIYDVENLPSHQYLFIKSFNGKPYTWPGYDDVISDEEVFELLDKTGLWEGLIRESIHVFKNPKTDEDSGYKIMVAVIKRLEDKTGNPYTDYTDLDPRLKIKFLESDEWGIKVYIDTESMGESDEEFEVFTTYGNETRRHMTNRNVMKFWHGYKLNDDEDDTHPSFKSIIYNRLIKLRNNLGLKSKLRVSILP